MGRRTKKCNACGACESCGGTPTRTVVIVVQDKSGSMSSCAPATISGYNEYLGDLKRDARNDDSDVRVSLVQFDTSVRTVYTSRPVNDVQRLTREDYVPGGMTALYDAVGRAVRDTERSIRRGDRVLVVLMTDGGENASREWRHDGILRLFEDKRRDDWEFIFLGAGEEAWNTGNSLGFTGQNSINYAPDNAFATQQVFRELAQASSSVMRGSSASSYLSSSPVKASLESDAGYTSVVVNTPNTQWSVDLDEHGLPIVKS